MGQLFAENIERLRNFEHTQIWISLNNPIEIKSRQARGFVETNETPSI